MITLFFLTVLFILWVEGQVPFDHFICTRWQLIHVRQIPCLKGYTHPVHTVIGLVHWVASTLSTSR